MRKVVFGRNCGGPDYMYVRCDRGDMGRSCGKIKGHTLLKSEIN